MSKALPNPSVSAINENKYWYKDAIIYELHIKAFSDSNGDGTGDFEGLIDKLDYLSDLGVTAIWVLPFYPSPLRDDGYDIADYYSHQSLIWEYYSIQKIARSGSQAQPQSDH